MGSDFLVALALLVVVIACIYLYLDPVFKYWKNRGIPEVGRSNNLENFKHLLLGTATIYEMQVGTYKSLNGLKYAGCYDFFKPNLILRDPELIERILVKDFNYFMDRGIGPSHVDDILTLNLTNAEGERWRTLRYKLTPTFTSGKLKGMFQQIDRCCDDLIRYIVEESANGDGQLDCKPLMNRFALNVIATCAFGLEFAYYDKERDRFLEMVNRTTNQSFKQSLRMIAQIFFPGLCKILRIKSTDPKAAKYFIDLIKEAFRYRTENNTRRNDFLQLLLDLKKVEENEISSKKEDTEDIDPEDAVINQMHHVSGNEYSTVEKYNVFSFERITALAVAFLTAGAESATSLMTFFLLSLATHSDIQSKLQNEVDKVLQKHGQWNFQTVKDMTYIDQVIQETMRMYPVVISLLRKCTKPYRLPDRDVIIQPGTLVHIPVYSLHFDPEYYPDPEKFDPDRFIDTNYKPNGRFLPFGDGPRICIGMRFVVFEMKICLARLIAEYSVTLGSKTKIPMQAEPRGSTKLPKGGIWLKFEKRKTQY